MSLNGIDWGTIGAATGTAILFGLGFAWLTNVFRKAKMLDDGLSGVLVVFGVSGIVVIGTIYGIVPLEVAIGLAFLFAGGGIPMLFTAVKPKVNQRMKEIDQYRQGKDQ